MDTFTLDYIESAYKITLKLVKIMHDYACCLDVMPKDLKMFGIRNACHSDKKQNSKNFLKNSLAILI